MSKLQNGSKEDVRNSIGKIISLFMVFLLAAIIVVSLWTELKTLFDSSSADNGNSSSQQAIAGDTLTGSSLPTTDLFPSDSLSTPFAAHLVLTLSPQTEDGPLFWGFENEILALKFILSELIELHDVCNSYSAHNGSSSSQQAIAGGIDTSSYAITYMFRSDSFATSCAVASVFARARLIKWMEEIVMPHTLNLNLVTCSHHDLVYFLVNFTRLEKESDLALESKPTRHNLGQMKNPYQNEKIDQLDSSCHGNVVRAKKNFLTPAHSEEENIHTQKFTSTNQTNCSPTTCSGYGDLRWPGRSLMSKQQNGSDFDSEEYNNVKNCMRRIIGVFVWSSLTAIIIVSLWTELKEQFDSSSADNGSSSSQQRIAGDTLTGSSFAITDLFPSDSLSTPRAVVCTEPPQIDNGGILMPSDQNVDVVTSSSSYHDLGHLFEFAPLEEENDGYWWEQISTEYTRTETNPAPKQVMPIPALQIDLQTDKNITAPLSSSCSHQTYWPHVHQQKMNICESTTLQNLNQECSQQEETHGSMNGKIDLSLQGYQIPQSARSPLRPLAFLNERESSVELALASTRVTNVDANKNFHALAHFENENASKAREITSQDLQKVVGKKRSLAAETLGVSISTFKRIRKENGISKWPDYRNEKQCSLLREKLQTDSIQEDEYFCVTSSHSGVVGPNHQNSIGSEPQGEKIMLPPYKTLSTSGQARSTKDLRNLCSLAETATRQGVPESRRAIPTCSDPTPEQPLATFPTIMPHVTEIQDARTKTIKATYKKYNLRFQFSSTKVNELKEKVAKRLQVELDSFDIQYEDDEKELVLIACDEDLEDCVNLFKSLGDQKVRLLVTDR